MKRIFSVNYSDGAFNFCMFLLRLSFGLLMIIKHGMPKLMSFSTMQDTFYSFLGLGPKLSLILAIFAELFCGLFIVLGLFTRLAAVVISITMLVAIFGANAGKSLPESEMAILYLSVFIFMTLCGPGKISVDNMIN